ncbi:hypothetical protein FY148_10705 [Agrobacterium tumefaciens]|uniref:hypothetical protein n=1 Tax=Agrobacterium tumefaciens TaxID=358 RepID=UPI0021CF4F00|nr:hypothetical protein [Agrobacterium tumefaciens]UXS53088.1 hypothetical protein FY148_10705 [Agrobacterium tumefaciens]UXS63332.1 hypothetical protein FY147_10705 [Agrobacterium tumefaciens]
MANITEHLREPNITIDQHVRSQQIALGQALSERRAVYLDTKFWILLRNAQKDAQTSEAHELLTRLRNAVASGVLFCPISESIFLELMKQEDVASRSATASLIDELSLGATLIPEDVRLATEIAHFMHASSGRTNLHPLKHLVWTKLSYVMGVTHPSNTPFDAATERAMQKAFFDHMWAISLTEIIAILGSNKMSDVSLGDVATDLNAGIAAHAHELRSFAQSYSAEAQGIVDLVGGMAIDIMISMARDQGITLPPPTSEERKRSETSFKNLFRLALERNKAREALRTMHILASLHASVRWNKGRKLSGNDLYDFHHAAAALGYCDAFFTERSLRTTVTQEHLGLDRAYDCHVVADVQGAIDWVACDGKPDRT